MKIYNVNNKSYNIYIYIYILYNNSIDHLLYSFELEIILCLSDVINSFHKIEMTPNVLFLKTESFNL